MACIRNLSKIWSKRALLVGVAVYFFQVDRAEAAFATRFSLSVGEEYTDNIFFTKKKDHDFVTFITPTLILLYAPAGETAPTLNLNISPGGQIFARHSELNNFGDNISLNGGYTYLYSPRLNFHVSDTLRRSGETRGLGTSSGGGSVFSLNPTPTSLPPVGSTIPRSSSQKLDEFISAGDTIANNFALRGFFRYRENVSFTGGYSNSYVNYIDAGGSDIFHSIGFRGVYNWRQEHNLHAGYSISIGRSRDGDDSVIHNFDFGDDYFSQYQVQLSPTLTLAASTGISFNAGSAGPRVANNTNVTITKLWETATLTGGVRKGLTPSFGVAGISDTTSFFTYFNMRLTERLSGTATIDFSLFNTKDVNFKTLEGRMGLQYLITPWLSSNLVYSHRWIDSGAGATSSDLLERGTVNSNNVFLVFTAHFDIWPNLGLARGMAPPPPILRTPFPTTAPSTPLSQP